MIPLAPVLGVVAVGGEEFVLLLVKCPLADAQIKAERLRAEIEAAMPAGHRARCRKRLHKCWGADDEARAQRGTASSGNQ